MREKLNIINTTQVMGLLYFSNMLTSANNVCSV